MKKKIVEVVVCILLIAAAILPVTGTEIVDDNQRLSYGLVDTIECQTMRDLQFKYDNGKTKPSDFGYQSDKPDLVIFDPSGGLIGDGTYESPATITQISGPFWHWFIFYVFVIGIQNDGLDWMNSSTIQTTRLSGWAFPASRLLYPSNGGYAAMPLTGGPNFLDLISPGGSKMMFLIVIKFPFMPQVEVELDVVSISSLTDSIIVHT